jgi:4-amino-4-deoxy-L-arabinose transferase-like glycosyltransferase
MRPKINWWLVLLLGLGAVLRLIWLDKLPVGFTPDEAAFGYNAYSILETGKDEWGVPWYQLFSQNLRSFGDYKLPLYAFLAVPSVKLFGLNEFSTRLPNAIVGTLAIAAVYFLATRLFPKTKVGLLAAFLLAISPWNISLSRGAFEANLATLFLPLAIYLFLSSRFVFSAVFLTAGFYSYHSARFFVPLVAILLLVFHRPQFKSISKFIVILALLTVPGWLSQIGQGSSRAVDVGIFNPTDKWEAVASRRFIARINGLPDSLARIVSNKPIFLTSLFINNYVTYFSPQFLFTQGAAEGTYGMIPGRGALFLLELPLLIAFVVYLIKHPSKSAFLLSLLIALSPIPAAMAKGPGYAGNRAVIMSPFIIIALAAGFIYLLRAFPKYSKPVMLITLSGFLISLLFFLEDYIYLSPTTIGQAMLYGRGEAIQRSAAMLPEYPLVKVNRSLSEPHIYVAFYLHIPPAEYQAASVSWRGFETSGYKFLDQYPNYRLGKFIFGGFNVLDNVTSPVLYIGKATDFPDNYSNFFTVFSPDGNPAVTVAPGHPLAL